MRTILAPVDGSSHSQKSLKYAISLIKEGLAADIHNHHLAVNIGFTTFSEIITAASDWNELGQSRRLLQALPGSYESLFHDTDLSAFFWISKIMILLPNLESLGLSVQ